MPQDLQQEVISIREWLAKEPHLPKDLDDFILEKFLHSCYGSLQKTKKCIERFCSTRSVMSEIYILRNPISPSMETAFSITNVSNYEAGENEILIHQFEDPTLEKFNFYDILKSFSIQADMWLMEQKFLPEGHIIILDMNNYSLRMIPRINIFLIREFFMYLLEGMPVRVKQIYAINAPSFYDKLFALIKPVLPSEICNIIQFLPDCQSLHKHIDKKYLPSEYGGEAESMKAQHKNWIDQIQKARNFSYEHSHTIHGRNTDEFHTNFEIYLNNNDCIYLSGNMAIYLEAMPVRVKQIYAINAPSFYDKLFALIKPVLPSEICNIIQFLPDCQSLHKHIDKKYLPSEYGGEAESMKAQHKSWIDQIQKARARFLNDNLWKADLKKKSKNNSFENTMNGSFKTLCID
ncbi:Alpha-tocopherol transfer protein-like [Papilio machaon]|uniref:Alpha-tocopherol transfer protein-like n=1 Tax=Papilio machaon TaxID=76193 RepID=A0A0N1PG26_PAPMA|nr:Alpha-tocopherol transfer protein-like [Papilio machaon]